MVVLISPANASSPNLCGPIAFGDLLGTYAVAKDGSFYEGEFRPGQWTMVSAINTAVLRITKDQAADIGWLYVDQLGARWVKLRKGVPSGETVPFHVRDDGQPTLVTSVVSIPKGYKIVPCTGPAST